MAPSNWDTFAISSTAKGPCDGRLRTGLGVEVEIYKNWLYVRDEQAWRKGMYVEPTVMEIQEGELTYLDLTVKAVRGPQEGVYVVAYEGGNYATNPQNMMVGCGVYGYARESDEPRWLGVRAESVRFLRSHLQKEQGEYRTWEINDDKYWAADKVARFNQGDRYIAERIGHPIPATAPDEAEEPLLTRMLKGDQADG